MFKPPVILTVMYHGQNPLESTSWLLLKDLSFKSWAQLRMRIIYNKEGELYRYLRMYCLTHMFTTRIQDNSECRHIPSILEMEFYGS
jgi:hypothetical protein